MDDNPGRVGEIATHEVPEGLTFILLALFSFLAYLVTPWWLYAETAGLRWAYGIVTGGLCVYWARTSCGDVRFRLSRQDVSGIFLAGIVLLVPNVLPLASDFAWKGDEDFHVSQNIRLADTFYDNLPLSAAALIGAFGIAAALALSGFRGKKTSWKLILAAACAALGTVAIFSMMSADLLPAILPFRKGLLRYPFIEKYFSVIPVILSYPIFDHRPPEIVFRLVPFASAVLMSWHLAKKTGEPILFPRLLLVLAIGTCPLLFYYSSLLYLEMPCVLLMTIACHSANDLLTKPAAEVRRMPSWIALILTGFLKETAIPFLSAFLVCRWLVQGGRYAKERNEPATAWIRGEFAVSLGVLLPFAILLFPRFMHGSQRSFGFHFSNLLDLQAYLAVAKSYLLQFGPWLALSAGGFAALWRRKDRPAASFLLLSIAALTAFHLLDNTRLAGYSRFNLFAAPMVIVSGCVFLQTLSDAKHRRFTLALAFVVIANLWMAPFHVDGSRKARWGDSTESVVEWTFPFRSAIAWIGEHHNGRRILIAGLDYPYRFIDYYMRQPFRFDMLENRETREEKERFREALERASSEKYDALLYPVRDEQPAIPSGFPWKTEKVFENKANRLILYQPIK